MTDLNQTPVEALPPELRDWKLTLSREGGTSVRGMQGIREKGMFNVSQQEFLVLLFVVETQDDAPQRLLINGALKESLHLLVNVRAKGKDLIE
jgi:hypothetical protein